MRMSIQPKSACESPRKAARYAVACPPARKAENTPTGQRRCACGATDGIKGRAQWSAITGEG